MCVCVRMRGLPPEISRKYVSLESFYLILGIKINTLVLWGLHKLNSNIRPSEGVGNREDNV